MIRALFRLAFLAGAAFVCSLLLPARAEKKSGNRATVESRVKEFGNAARGRWSPRFQSAGVSYPPGALLFLGLKQERRLEVWARDDVGQPWSFIASFPILAASGGLGPKLAEGDRQVPEGFYRIESLNPNSRYHLSLRINYPNEHDRRQARLAGRTNLGGDIMIHGKAVSVGCLAMGDEVAEDLFVIAAASGLEKIEVLLSPVDFRVEPTWRPDDEIPDWVDQLYDKLTAELLALPPKPSESDGKKLEGDSHGLSAE
ncbi:MAG: L,D-transpeptidase family protein [Verrucomicrobiia bacterium]